MAESLPQPFAEGLAERMRAAHAQLAARWLDELRELLIVPPEHVFPSASLLDHIPGLIEEIAAAIASSADEAIIANTVVTRKAQELGELRFDQKATVHQLLREYRLLGEVLNSFVADQVASGEIDVAPADVLIVSARLHQSVFVLMQTTVDTFVSRYATTIEQQTRRLEGFNRTVSHELRQPLGAIRSAVELLARPETTTGEVHRRCLEIVTSNTRRMASLTSTLLLLSSLDSKSIEVQEIDLARVVTDVAEQLAEMAEGRQVNVRIAVPPTRLNADLARLELVAVNLISNAIKYSDPRKAERFVEVRATRDAAHVRLSVTDNGR
jgi:signal transduction histidine kinase